MYILFVFQSIYDLFLGPSEELHLLPEPLFSLPCEQLVTTALQGTDTGRWGTFSRQTLYMLYPVQNLILILILYILILKPFLIPDSWSCLMSDNPGYLWVVRTGVCMSLHISPRKDGLGRKLGNLITPVEHSG